MQSGARDGADIRSDGESATQTYQRLHQRTELFGNHREFEERRPDVRLLLRQRCAPQSFQRSDEAHLIVDVS